HWDGSAWRRVPGPKVAGPHTFHVVVAGAGSVLLSGSGDNGVDPFLFESDGRSWRRVVLPDLPAPSLQVSDIAVVGSNDLVMLAWNFEIKSSGFGRSDFGVFHRRGGAWTRSLTATDVLDSMVVFPDGSIVVGGYTKTARARDRRTVVKRWNGSRWSDMPAPPEPMTGINGLAGRSATDLWAVGASDPLEVEVSKQPLEATADSKTAEPQRVEVFVSHWNGTKWSSPKAGIDSGYSDINAVDSGPDGTIVAVGWTSGVTGRAPAEASGELILRRC
ncbi:MAG TPA: hypothetical protein VM841_02725, partial [Actinomycetota bacterium]|nr:hypothetical protein [Actinomycetota bacterium]